MAHKSMIAAFALIGVVLPAAALARDMIPPASAPAGSAETRYCMRIDAVTGTRLERIRCWTREEWAEQGVDVDREWSREGVRTIG